MEPYLRRQRSPRAVRIQIGISATGSTQVTATVSALSGSNPPTGSVEFIQNGTILASSALTTSGSHSDRNLRNRFHTGNRHGFGIIGKQSADGQCRVHSEWNHTCVVSAHHERFAFRSESPQQVPHR